MNAEGGERSQTALITGVTGQDGRLLARLLLSKGFRVVGTTRDIARARALESMPVDDRFQLVECALDRVDEVGDLLVRYRPDQVYNLASQSSPQMSWSLSLQTADATGIAAHRLLEAARRHHPRCRIYQASSSEMFGNCGSAAQDETTPFRPVNPYAAAKVYAHNIATTYREAYGMFVACGILFNHESPLRGTEYLTQRIAYGAACAALGIRSSDLADPDGRPLVDGGKLVLGNLLARRDWGAAVDAVRAMLLILTHADPEDFVIGTGKIRSVGDLCAIAYGSVGLEWQFYVRSEPRLLRTVETGPTVADATKARGKLGWRPQTAIESILVEMTERHLARLGSATPSPARR